MATYVCSATVGRLTPVQKTEIARSVSEVHEGETGTERMVVDADTFLGAPARAAADCDADRMLTCRVGLSLMNVLDVYFLQFVDTKTVMPDVTDCK